MVQSQPMTADGTQTAQLEPHLAHAAATSAVVDSVAQAGNGSAPPAEPTPGEPAPEPAAAAQQTPAVPTDPNVTAQFAALMRRDNRIREREQALQQQETELNELRQMREQLRRDPYAVVTQNGGSLEEWSSRLLQQEPTGAGQPAVPREVIQELEDLRSWRQQQEQAQQQQQQEAQQQQAQQGYATAQPFQVHAVYFSSQKN